jgi:hypothetical protein
MALLLQLTTILNGTPTTKHVKCYPSQQVTCTCSNVLASMAGQLPCVPHSHNRQLNRIIREAVTSSLHCHRRKAACAMTQHELVLTQC